MRLTALISFLAVSLLWLSSEALTETLYGEDLAWQLANPGDIRRITGTRSRLRREDKEAEPLFILKPPPFEDIAAAPNTSVTRTRRAESWDIPPWPAVGPPEENLAGNALEQQQPGTSPDAFSELVPQDTTTISKSLRPKVVPLDEQFVFRIKEIPEPFSLRRYYDREDVFAQVAAYGGTTSFKAEEAFRAMKEAATRQTLLEGLGTEAFLTRIEVMKYPEEEETDALPFEGVPVKGEERPELLDSGQAVALTAPAFQDVAVKDLEGKRIKYVEPYKRRQNRENFVKQSLLVVVAFFPDEAVTVSLAIEERLGSVQDLVTLAMLVQKRLKNEIKPKV